MPCDCSGFPVEHTAFGKKFTGVSGGMTGSGRMIAEDVPWREMIEEGERALCKAQDVICDLWRQLSDQQLDDSMKKRVHEQLRMLAAHKESEGQDATEVRRMLSA